MVKHVFLIGEKFFIRFAFVPHGIPGFSPSEKVLLWAHAIYFLYGKTP